jgi:hypothetical protein
MWMGTRHSGCFGEQKISFPPSAFEPGPSSTDSNDYLVHTSGEKLLISLSVLETCYLVCHHLSSVLSGTFRCLEIMSLVSAHGVALFPI